MGKKDRIDKREQFFCKKAETKWALLQKEQSLPQDPIVLQKMLKESQIQQMKFQFYNEELIRTRDLLKETNQVAGIGVWEVDLITGKVYWSKITKKIREVALDFEPTLDSIIDFYKKGETQAIIEAAVRNAIETGKSYDLELLMVTGKGNERWVRSIGKAQMIDGQCVRLFGVLQDVTERKTAVERLADNEALLSTILDVLPAAVFVKDVQDEYKFLLWNKKSEEIFGLTAKQCIGKSDYDLFSKKNADRFRMKDIETSKMKGVLDIPEEVVESKNKRVLVHTQTTIVRNKNEFPCFLVGVSEDITARTLAEKKLQESKDKLENLFELSPDFMIKTRRSDLKFVDINQRACEFYGYTKEEFSELNFFDFELSLISNQEREQINNKLELGEVVTVEGIHRKKDGTIFPAQIRVCKLDESYELAAITDITDRKKKDAELKKLSLVAQKTNNAVIILDQDVNIEWVNEGFEKMTGYSAQEAIGKKMSKLLDGDYSDWDLVEQLQVDMNKNKSSLFEIPSYKKDKQLYWRSISITSFVDSDGLSKYIVIESDITEQKRIADVIKESKELVKAKEKVEESEKRLNDASRIARLGYWELDLGTGEEVWSDELYRIFELTPEEISPSEASFLSNVHPKDRTRVHETYASLTKSKSPYHITYWLKLHNGNLKYVSERCRSEFSEDDALLRSIGTIQDITEQKIAEDNLKKSIKEIEDLKYALDQSSMVLTISNDLAIIAANGNFCKGSGYNEEELIGKHFNMMDSGFHPKWVFKKLWKVVRSGEVWKGELKNKAKDGSFYWVDTAVVPFMDEQGNSFQYVVIQKDITEKKYLEEELELANEAEFAKLYKQQKIHIAEIEEQSTELDRIFNLSIDMISVITPDGLIKRVNPAFARVLGYTEKELFEIPLIDFVHQEDLAKTQKEFSNLMEGQDIMSFENRYRTKNGEYRWMSWRAVSDKETKLSYVITRDITHEKLASRKIEDLTYTLNQTAIVIIVGKDQNIISVNDKFCETSGYTNEEIIGQTHSILDSLHHSDEFWAEVRGTIESGQIWQGEIKERAKDGTFYWTYTSTVPFLNEEGVPFQYIVIQTDITERKQLEIDLRSAKEEAVKNTEIKEDFLANMSHEIRTPMSGVLGFSRLLLQTNMNESQLNYAQSIYSSAENLLVVINDILDVSKIESGKFQLDKIEFDLKKRIQDTINILKVAIQNRKLNFRINFDPNIPSLIVAAPNRISQILINLIGNSIKFTKQGHIQLNVKLQKMQVLLFEVKDTGIGIPDDKLDTIFESFTQAESYTTREHGGTGLGLSICKKLVTLMGGAIGVESKLGQGATFYFTIPFKTDPNASYVKEVKDNKHLVSSKATAGVKILVVEDNLVNQELALIYLDILNCDCDLAINGEEAIRLLAQCDYDLILMDIQMPKMDGITATLEIRKNDNLTPIIAMTAHALIKEKEKCFDIGMNDYISKPFKIEQLQEVILKYTAANIKTVVKKKKLDPLSLSKKSSKTSFEHLVEVMEGNVDLAKEILLIFKEELIKFDKNMNTAFAENNIPIIKKHIHKIKPNFELMLLTNLYDIADEIFDLVTKNASIAKIKLLYVIIESAIPELLKDIDEMRL